MFTKALRREKIKFRVRKKIIDDCAAPVVGIPEQQ